MSTPPKFGTVSGHLSASQSFLWAASELRKEQVGLRYKLIVLGDDSARITRELNRRVREDAHRAIYCALKAAVLLRTHTGVLA
jgi:hypothetical protein